MKFSLLILAACVALFCGCVAMGPAVSKADMGNVEINIVAAQGMEVRAARIYVDDVFIGNMSERMPILYLKRGKRTVRVELEEAEPYEQSIHILGEPNHQVLNVRLKGK